MYIAKAMGVATRAKGMTEIAREIGLSREQLYRSFSEKGNPRLKTMLALNISFKLVMPRLLTNLYKSISLKNFQKVTVFQASQ